MFSIPTRWCSTQNSLPERWNKLSLPIISYQPKTGWWTCCVSRGSLEGSKVFAFSLLWLRYWYPPHPTPPPIKEISLRRTWGNPDMDRSVEFFNWNFLNTAFVRGFPARLELQNLPSHLFYNLRGPPPRSNTDSNRIISESNLTLAGRISISLCMSLTTEAVAPSKNRSVGLQDANTVMSDRSVCGGGVGHLYSI